MHGPSIRSNGIIENFLPRQGTESARCTIFRSDAVVFFGRIPLVGRSVDERRPVALPPNLLIHIPFFIQKKKHKNKKNVFLVHLLSY